MQAQTRVKINGFDFDSLQQVQGEVFDAAKTEFRSWLYVKIRDNLIALNLILLGIYLGHWWYYGGFWLLRVVLSKYAAWALRLAETGQM